MRAAEDVRPSVEPAPGVTRVPILFVNAYLIDVAPGDPGRGWALFDTGLSRVGRVELRSAAARRYGNSPPQAIVLSHGHFDHAGSAKRLAGFWQAPVFSHRLELPYLTGRTDYPPPDPTVGGAFALMSRTFPYRALDLGLHIRALPDDGSVPGLPGWQWVHTPGHTAGHLSLWRDTDRTLLAGDAVTTMNQDSWKASVTMSRELRHPPAPLTTDWHAARQSVHRLAVLRPNVIASGHGLPLAGPDVAGRLAAFANDFTPPPHGRYVNQPVYADNRGVLVLPPRVPDPAGRFIRGAVAAAGVAAVFAAVSRVRRRA
jgi:glyoxylase-like metal-dependent hydrolase (beta-lactamase superfamily II)